jgi:hypothetical protein
VTAETGRRAESYHGKLRALAGDDEVLIMADARCLLLDDQGRILLITGRQHLPLCGRSCACAPAGLAGSAVQPFTDRLPGSGLGAGRPLSAARTAQ